MWRIIGGILAAAVLAAIVVAMYALTGVWIIKH